MPAPVKFQLISGAYTAHYTPAGGSSLLLGETENGFELITSYKEQSIKCDRFGEAELDAIQQGVQYSVRATFLDTNGGAAGANTASLALHTALETAIAAQGKVTTGALSVKANVGKRVADLAGVLKLTPLATSSAATALGAGKSYYFYKAVVSGEVIKNLNSKARRVPLTFKCYPSLAADATLNHVYDIKT